MFCYLPAGEISIHALREEGDGWASAKGQNKPISIHALREEGDLQFKAQPKYLADFYPRPP